MKKIVGIMAVAAMATSLFAADFAARVYMTGNVAAKAGDGASLIQVNKQDQKDADALVISGNTDNAGAKFQFWYNYDASGSANLVVRSTSLWFKPADMFKVTIGDVEGDGYTEMIHWWMDATGASLAQANGWDNRWSNYNTASGSGVEFELAPIDGLTAKLTIAPGAGTAFINTTDKGATGAYGLSVAYNLSGATGLPISAQVAYRDNCLKGDYKNRTKILAIGADYGNNWADGFYGFLNARMYFASTNAGYSEWNADPVSLRGVALDNYLKYAKGAFKVMSCTPVTIRLSGEDGDPSFMTYDVKATYAVGSFVPYLEILDNGNAGTYAPVAFDGSTDFDITVKPGVSFNVGSCGLDFAIVADINATAGTFSWSVPFTASVAF